MAIETQCGEIRRTKEFTDGSYRIRIAQCKMRISLEGEVIKSDNWDYVKHLADHHPLFTWDNSDNMTKVLYLGFN